MIQRWGRPTLVISHNKTLAAQLYGEFKHFFPENAVGYFVSYYDYYQPEAYVASTNTYIAKDASINDDIDRLRLQATSMLLEREDVIIVASVSCIYGLGTPEDWRGMRLDATAGERVSRQALLAKLVEIQYTRNDLEVGRGNFRVRGDVVEVHPAYEDTIIRIELDDDLVARISALDPVTGHVTRRMERLALYPAKHFVTPEPRMREALAGIRAELAERLAVFRAEGKLLEAQRLKQRTEYDLEMLATIGSCPGVENYSRHLSGRGPGDRPGCLIDYFPRRRAPGEAGSGSADFLLVIDESHVTVPQIGGMYEGDRVRKQTARQPAAALRRVRGADRAVALYLGDARRVRAPEIVRRGGGADHPAHRAGGPRGGGQAGAGPGGRPARGDPPPRGGPRAHPGHDTHQAHGRGSHRLPRRDGRQGALPP